jgi:uncharacterized protein involved in propanediol utilization
VRAAIAVEIPVADLLAASTVADLARVIRAAAPFLAR